MSTVQPTDKVLVNRAGTDYSATADTLMATIQDTDLLLVNRAGVDYKCSGLDFKAAMIPPESVDKPSITSPSNGAADVGATPTLTSSAFSGHNGATHVSTDWQVTTAADTGFAAIVTQSMADTTNKVSWDSGDLAANTDYIARVRYHSAGAASAWSDVVSFKTANEAPFATISPGTFYTKSTQTVSGPSIPFMTALPANADRTDYIDVVSCADNTPALLLDTNNSLWVVTSAYTAPMKSTPPGLTGHIIKIAGGFAPSYAGNALVLTDTGELWRGWALSDVTASWQKVTLAGINSADVISLSSQAYGDAKGIAVEVMTGGTTQWYLVPCDAKALGAPVATGPAGAKQVVLSNPFAGAGAVPAWLDKDWHIGGGATLADKKYKKLIAAGYSAVSVIAIAEDGTARYVMGGTAAITPPAGETVIKDIIMPCEGGYGSRAFLLGGSGKVYITSSNVTGDGLVAATWLECTDLKDKYATFGTLSFAAPVVSGRSALIVPN